MSFTGGGDSIGQALIDIVPQVDQAELQRAATQMTRSFERFVSALNLGPAQKQIDNITAATKRAGQSAAEARAQFVELAIGLEVAGRSITQFVSVPLANFIKGSVTEASHLNEVINQTKVIFGESAQASINWAEELDAAFGLTQTQALEANNNFARLFNEVGVGMEQSAEISQALVERIGDLASFTDFPIEDVIRRVQSGLVGETEAVRRLGIILDESVVKQKAYSQGIVETGEALNTQQKFLLRAQQILEQTSEAQGDASRTADTYAGQLRQLNRNVSELQKEVGQAFLPLFTTLAGVFNSTLQGLTGLAEGFQDLPTPLRAIGLGFTGILVAIGPLTTVAGRLLVIFRTATTLTNGLTVAQTRLTAALGANTAAARVATVAFTNLNKALPFIGLGIAAIALAAPIIRDLKGDIDELAISIEKLKDPTLQNRASFDDAFLNTPELIIQTTDEIKRLKGLLQEPDSNTGSILELIDSLEKANLAETNTALGLFKDLLKQGALGAAEGAIKQFELQNANGQLNSVIARMNALLDEEVSKRQKLNKEQQRSSDIINGISESARNATNAQEDFTKSTEDLLKQMEAIIRIENTRKRADEDVAKARERAKEAADNVTEAERELNLLRQQGKVNLEALASAEERVADARERVVDAQSALAEAQTPADAEDIAAAEDDILSAEVALRKVRRDNVEAVEDLNNALQQQERLSINLAGLNLDQIKGAIANARESARALQQKAQLTKDDNEVVKTAEELADEALERDIAERESLRRLADAQEKLTELKKEGTDADEDVITATRNLTKATEDLTAAQEEARLAGLEDPARVEAIFEAEQRVTKTKQDHATALKEIRDAEIERKATLAEIALQTAQISGNEIAINNAIRERIGLNAQLFAQQPQVLEQFSRQVVSSFNFGSGLGGILNKTRFGSPEFIDQLAQALIATPGTPLRDILRRLGVPPGLIQGFKTGGVITGPQIIQAGEGYKAEAVVPLTNARNAISALQKGWGYMSPSLQAQLGPAIAPKAVTRTRTDYSLSHSGGSSSRPSPELQTLQAILAKLDSAELGNTTIEAPIQVGGRNDELQARKIRRELEKLQKSRRGRPDARM